MTPEKELARAASHVIQAWHRDLPDNAPNLHLAITELDAALELRSIGGLDVERLASVLHQRSGSGYPYNEYPNSTTRSWFEEEADAILAELRKP